MEMTEEEVAVANARGKARTLRRPRAVAARYDRSLGQIVVELSNEITLMFKPQTAEGLERAKPAQLAGITVSPSGFGLHFPVLDVDLYLPGLLKGLLGSMRWHAAELGGTGGRARTSAKASAARENGKLGGRPRKPVETPRTESVGAGSATSAADVETGVFKNRVTERAALRAGVTRSSVTATARKKRGRIGKKTF